MTEDAIDPNWSPKLFTSNSEAIEKVEKAYKQFRSTNTDNNPEFGEIGGESIDDFSWF